MDLANPFHNPVFVLLLSWAIGAMLEPMLRKVADDQEFQTNLFATREAYELIGVQFVRWIIVKGRLNCNAGLNHLSDHRVETLIETPKAMTVAEFGHWLAFAVMLVATVAAYFAGFPRSVIASCVAANVLGNTYLSLVQQYNKIRIDSLIRRAEKRPIAG